MDSKSDVDISVSDIIDLILYKLSPERTMYTKDEIVDMLLDIRQEYKRDQ